MTVGYQIIINNKIINNTSLHVWLLYNQNIIKSRPTWSSVSFKFLKDTEEWEEYEHS